MIVAITIIICWSLLAILPIPVIKVYLYKYALSVIFGNLGTSHAMKLQLFWCNLRPYIYTIAHRLSYNFSNLLVVLLHSYTPNIILYYISVPTLYVNAEK